MKIKFFKITWLTFILYTVKLSYSSLQCFDAEQKNKREEFLQQVNSIDDFKKKIINNPSEMNKFLS